MANQNPKDQAEQKQSAATSAAPTNETADAAKQIDSYFNQIQTISSKMIDRSTNISQIFSKMNQLNKLIQANEIKYDDNQVINRARQSIAVSMIKLNNQKIKALTAKNDNANITIRYNNAHANYINARKAVQNDIRQMNDSLSNGGQQSFKESISTLNSHNALITSYSNLLSSDRAKTSEATSQAHSAVTVAFANESTANSAYQSVKEVNDTFHKRIASDAKLNNTQTRSLASRTLDMVRDAKDYGEQIASIADKYAENAQIKSANSDAAEKLASINSMSRDTETQASNAAQQLNSLNINDTSALGTAFNTASMAFVSTKTNANHIASASSAITSNVTLANSIADQLFAQQAACEDGYNDYLPAKPIQHLNSKTNSQEYIKMYTQGFEQANAGFDAYLKQFLNAKKVKRPAKETKAFLAGFDAANLFIQAVDAARKGNIKDHRYIHETIYNYGYSAYREFSQAQQEITSTDENLSLNLKQSLPAILGFLYGQNRE